MSDALHMSHSALLGMGSAPWGEYRCIQPLEIILKQKQHYKVAAETRFQLPALFVILP